MHIDPLVLKIPPIEETSEVFEHIPVSAKWRDLPGFRCTKCHTRASARPQSNHVWGCKTCRFFTAAVSSFFETDAYRKVRIAVTQNQYLVEFKKLTDLMYETTSKKNADYADADDAFANLRVVSDLTGGKVSTEVGILTRMSDKFKRFAGLLFKEAKVVSESIEDTLLDLAVYCLILILYLRSKNGIKVTAGLNGALKTTIPSDAIASAYEK
jgi:hypothetical protein